MKVKQTNKDKLDILNDLLKSVFIQGVRIGVCFSQDKREELLTDDEHFKEDGLIDNDLQFKTDKLIKLLGITDEEVVIYTKESDSQNKDNFSYIIQFIDIIKK